MHAHFWESSKIKDDWLNPIDSEGKRIPVYFDSFYQLFLDSEDKNALIDEHKAIFAKKDIILGES
jgi:hypothetical protein